MQTSTLPDLATFNSPRLTKLQLDLPTEAAHATVAALVLLLRGNSSLRHLTLKGAHWRQAQSVAAAIVDSPDSGLQHLSFGAAAALPVAGLLGRGGAALMEWDAVGPTGPSSSNAPPAAAGGLPAEEAAALAAILPHAPALAALNMGPNKHLPNEVLALLTAALLAAAAAGGPLKVFNRLQLARAAPGGVVPPAIDLAGMLLGPLGAALLGQQLMQVRYKSLLKLFMPPLPSTVGVESA